MAKEASLLLRIKTAGEEALGKVGSALSAIGQIGGTAFALISAAVVKGISEYSEQESAINALNRTMVNNGNYSKELSKAYIDQADALSKVTLFGDEQIIQAQSSFSQQAKNIQLTKDGTSAILDFAQAQGMDLASAANLVGKAVGTSNNALSRYGIEITKGASESEKMAQVLAGLNSKFGGQAEAATSGLGALKLLNKSVGEIFESLGQRLAPTITWVARELNALAQGGPAIDTFLDIFSNGFIFATKSASGLMTVVQVVSTAVGGTIGAMAGAIEQILQGNISGAWAAYKSGVTGIQADIENITMAGGERMRSIDQANAAAKVESYKKEEEDLRASLERKAVIADERSLLNQETELARMIEESNAKSEMELALLSGRESAIFAAELAAADARFANATTQAEKTQALADKYRATEQLNQAKANEAKQAAQKDTFGKIATLSNSSNATLASIGKAAALTQIAIDTPVAVSKAFAAFPPPFNFVAAGAVAAAMAAQAAQVAGIPLAEGGIVMPRPGGTQATIGEAGQAEAVIPLDRAGEFGLGGGSNITLIVNGGMLGTENEAREFAIVLDRELLKLRQGNESVSFDSRAI